MKRILSAVAAAALGLGLLTACGDDGDSGSSAGSGNYCDDLKDAKKEIDSIQEGDFGSLQKTVDTMHQLADEAPDEIKDDWETLTAGIDKLVAALEKAGLTDEDMANLQNGQMPDGADMEVLNQLLSELKDLDTQEFQQAGENIQKHAKDECGVDLQA